ncbi:hypothetical protein MD484_g6704, partial [Candolleomyces efflorescens]
MVVEGGMYYLSTVILQLIDAIIRTPNIPVTIGEANFAALAIAVYSLRVLAVPIFANQMLLNMKKVNDIKDNSLASTMFFTKTRGQDVLRPAPGHAVYDFGADPTEKSLPVMATDIPPPVLFLFRALHAEMNVSLIVIGIQLFMCTYGQILFMESPGPLRRGRLPYIVISWTIFLLFTLGQTINSHFVFNIVSGIVPLEEAKQDALMITGTVTVIAIQWVGDGLLLYRAYILWSEKLWLLVLPILTYLATIVIGILQLVPQVTKDPQGNPKFTSAWIYLSVAVNASITALISFRLLKARRYFSRVLPSGPQTTLDLNLYRGVVAILVESAMPLSLSGIIFAAVYDPKNVEQQIVKTTFLCLYFSFSALAPQMIIFRVTTGRSASSMRHKATSSFESQNYRGAPESLEFAHTAAENEPKPESRLH